MSDMKSTLAFLLGLGLVGFAGMALAEEALVELAAEEAVLGLDSSESTSADFKRRDPFWPVGYQPPTPEQAQAASEEEKLDRPWPTLPVRGRSIAPDGSYRVLVEGLGVVGVNRVVSVQEDGYRFYWRILRIDDQGLQLKRLGISKDSSPPKTNVPQDASLKENNS